MKGNDRKAKNNPERERRIRRVEFKGRQNNKRDLFKNALTYVGQRG